MNRRRQRELFECARSDDTIGVRRLIEQHLVDVNTTNISGHTPLYIACENGNLRVARHLLNNGARVCYGHTQPLIAAVSYNHYDCVKRLLEYHADANCTNLRGETPVSIALRKHPGNIKLILLLLQYDAIPSESFGDDIAVQLLTNAKAKLKNSPETHRWKLYQLDGAEHISGGI